MCGDLLSLMDVWRKEYFMHEEEAPKRPKSPSPARRRNQILAAAMNLAEERILSGTASSQLLVHFLKEASSKHSLEMEQLKAQNRLLSAKADSVDAAKKTDKMYAEALKAMRRYSGAPVGDDDDDDEQ